LGDLTKPAKTLRLGSSRSRFPAVHPNRIGAQYGFTGGLAPNRFQKALGMRRSTFKSNLS
jgi:hypothetical protein